MVAYGDPGQRGGGPIDAGPPRLVLRRPQVEVRLLPSAVVFPNESRERRGVEVPGREDYGVVGGVEALLVEEAVSILVGQVPDVLQVPPDRVLVGMAVESRVAQCLDQALLGVRGAGVILALDDRGPGLERVLGISRVDEPIGLGPDNLLQVIAAGEDDVKAGEVVCRGRIRPGAEPRQEFVVGGLGRLPGSLEHHVLEEMGEAGFARLDLVARAGTDDGVVGDDIGMGQRDGDDLEAVLQFVDPDGEGDDVRPRRAGGDGQRQDGQKPSNGGSDHGDSLGPFGPLPA